MGAEVKWFLQKQQEVAEQPLGPGLMRLLHLSALDRGDAQPRLKCAVP